MAGPLQPSDVPRRVRRQIAALADGRLLLRGPAGVRLLGGVAREDLERLLATIDGVRTAGEICDQLAADYERRDVLRLLGHLADGRLEGGSHTPETGHTTETRSSAASSHQGLDEDRVLVVGAGAVAGRLVSPLGRVVAPATVGFEIRLRDPELVVCVLEESSYTTVFEVQRACLRSGVASLWVTIDPDGARIGPAVIPGSGPCIACAQIASFRACKLTTPDLIAAVAGFRTGRVGAELVGRLAGEVTREAQALLAPAGRPRRLTSVRLLYFVSGAAGGVTYPVTPAADCPLCGGGGRGGAGRGGAGGGAAGDRPFADVVRRELVDRHRRSPRRVVVAHGNDLVTSIGIVGGGTAGYLTAMALRRKLPGLEVTLIESSAVPVVGVGEATTPLMPQFLHVDLGLPVRELFRQVGPTLKLGIRFEWGPPGGAFNYPFGPVHVLEPAVYDGDIRHCSPRSLLIEAGALPLTPDGGGWHSDLDVDVAYHLDNERFVRYLRAKAGGTNGDLGVRTVDARIAEVEVAEDGGSVTALVADDGRRFAFDLYVDCSGFRSLLLEKALGSPFISYGDSLFTDRALVARVPHGGEIRPYTLAETFSAGWCWSTPQRDADHRGYVFCSAFASPEDAEREMRRAHPNLGDPRLIEFRAGRHEDFWRGNVVAMGNAYGFVEPLESTALHMLIRQIGLLAGAFPMRRGERGVAGVLNRKVGAYWDYLGWFLALHYRFNRRLDTPFWRHCRRRTDVSAHGELLELFAERGPLSYQGSRLAGYDIPDPLWGAEGIDVVLLGQGVPATLPRPAVSRAEWQQRARLYRQVAEGSTAQAKALEILDREPDLLERWVAEFERVGAAFAIGR